MWIRWSRWGSIGEVLGEWGESEMAGDLETRKGAGGEVGVGRIGLSEVRLQWGRVE